MVIPRIVLCLLWLQLAGGVVGMTAATAAEAPDKPPPPAAIPVGEIAAQVETVRSRLRDMEASYAADPAIRTVTAELPALAREIDTRLLENERLLEQRPPLEMLISVEGGWRRLRERLAEWLRELKRSEARVGRDLEQLEAFEKRWTATRAAVPAGAAAEVIERIEAQLDAVRRGQELAARHQAQVLALQGGVAVQDTRVGEAVAALRQAREEMVSRLLVRDSPRIWDPDLRAGAAQALDEQARSSLAAQLATLREYAERRSGQFFVHAFLLALLAASFYWARGEVRRWLKDEPELQRTALVFQTPVATALVVTFFTMRFIYPQAPRLLWAAFGALALIPTAYILHRVVARELRPTLYVLVVFFFIDQVRAVTAAWEVLPRVLFLAQMVAAAGFSAWLVRSLRHPRGDRSGDRLRLTIKGGALAALVVCTVTAVANAAGYVRLANLLGNAALVSAYFALILYVTVAILDGLTMVALRLRPLRLLGMVQRHRPLLRRRIRLAFQWIAVLVWALFTLDQLTLREPVLEAVRDVLTAEAAVGALRVSLGDVLAFAVTVWAALLFSRLVRFMLEEDVYPRVDLARGLPYAISTVAHYLILVVGLFAAVAALGLDMTKATILAGAFTVGVGFGLQNIFNNFVSGLILLFERPVKVGDVIEIDPSSTGVVERIGIRASVIRTHAGAEVIVPNGRLISDRFTNWTFSSRARSIEVPVAVPMATDVEKAIAALERIASEHRRVVRQPPPKAIVTKLGPDWIGLELRAWTDQAANWIQVRSEVAVLVSKRMPAEGITLR